MKRIVLSALFVTIAATAQAMEPPRFVDDTGASGIVHSYEGGWEFFVGGGVAALDCDLDGRADMFVAGGSQPAKLYRNVSAPGGQLRFEDVSDAVTDLTDVSGAYPLDIDGDGHLDLAVLRVGENVLLRGQGDCRFERANEAWSYGGGKAWSTAFTARWDQGQYKPTLVFANYVDRNQPGSPFGTCHDNVLLRPDPDNGYTKPITLAPGYCSLSALFSDWNRDGVMELLLANDRQYYRGGQEQLWRIPVDGAPSLYTKRDGWRKLAIWGMGIASHDINGDGYPDYYITSMADNKLRILNQGADRPVYADFARKLGVTAHRPHAGGDILPSTGWHADFEDVNNDSFMDLFVTKGNVEAMKEFAARDPNNLLMGRPDGTFDEAGTQAGIVTYDRSRGGVLADFNLDGLLDLVVVNRKANVEVWRNVGLGDATRPVPLGNWLQLKLFQDEANRNAVGAWVEVRIGTKTIRREITVGGGHAGGDSGWVHFGVGTAERARVRVQWPGGEWGDWVQLYTNQFAVIRRGHNTAQLWLPPQDPGRS